MVQFKVINTIKFFTNIHRRNKSTTTIMSKMTNNIMPPVTVKTTNDKISGDQPKQGIDGYGGRRW